ncbi:hypothetical protein L249_0576, partial [Ophiocordyceps polyrhachis-furcata BCC 54312]
GRVDKGKKKKRSFFLVAPDGKVRLSFHKRIDEQTYRWRWITKGRTTTTWEALIMAAKQAFSLKRVSHVPGFSLVDGKGYMALLDLCYAFVGEVVTLDSWRW